MKRGPVSKAELETVVKLSSEGKSVEDIATEINRSVTLVEKLLQKQAELV